MTREHLSVVVRGVCWVVESVGVMLYTVSTDLNVISLWITNFSFSLLKSRDGRELACKICGSYADYFLRIALRVACHSTDDSHAGRSR